MERVNHLYVLTRLFLLSVLITPMLVHAQERVSVSGVITDVSSAPLDGVTVRVKETPAIVTSSDANGRFSLNVPPGSTLVFTLIGFVSVEHAASQGPINVVLEQDVSELEGVVVVAYGTQKKKEVVGAVTSINPSELKVPSSNLTTALAGRLAGVIAYQRSGEPGQDNAEFFIRGVTSFGYKKDPLILIDGVELSATELARLQPDDIASFSIMKDATATALYGARGANGVILVTTKVGRVEKAQISMRYESSLSSPTKNIQLADPVTYMRMENLAVSTRTPLQPLPYSESKIYNTEIGTNPYVYPATDWYKEVFRDHAQNHRFNFNVTGGGEVAQYYIAGTYNKDNGVLQVDERNNFNSNIDLRSYALRSNVTINVTNTTKAGVRLYGTFDDYSGPLYGGAEMYGRVMRSNPVLFPAYYPVDDAHRYLQHIMFGNSTIGTGGYINPYADLVSGYREYSKSLMMAQFEINQDLAPFVTEGLTFRAMANTNREAFTAVSRSYRPFYYDVVNYDKWANTYMVDVINPNEGTEYLGFTPGDKTVVANLYMEGALNYSRIFGDKHNVSGLLLFNMRSYLSGSEESLLLSLPSRNMGVSGRATYSFDDRYFAEFNFGYNGSERFNKAHRFGFFPSAGIAWSIANEKFMEDARDVFSVLKLRATYGLVGNDAIGGPEDRFFYMSNVNMNEATRGAVFGTENGYRQDGVLVTRYDNPLITWETARKTNIGVELGLFDKLEVQADFFNEYRDNILMARSSIPNTMGLSAPVLANVGEAAGRGVDMSVDFSHTFANGAWIVARGNYTYATSEYKVIEEPQYDERNLSKIGYSLGQRWGLLAERLFVDEADVANSPFQSFGLYGAGDIKYRDVNGDGVVTELDKVPLGFPTTPEVIYGFGFSAGHKNFDFSVFFQGSARSSFWINEGSSTLPFIGGNQLLQAYADSYWSEDNRDVYALLPRLSKTENTNNGQLSNWFMRNGSFLRLKSAELGYSIPEKSIERLGMKMLRVYASGTNLLAWSNFNLWDVEMGSQGLGYPVQRVVNLGVQVSL